jgi:hypothetical protein
MPSQNKYFMVDIGWTGTIQSNVAVALTDDGQIQGLYLGLNSQAYEHSFAKSKLNWLITTTTENIFSKSIFSAPQLLEVLTLAPHESFTNWDMVITDKEMEQWISKNTSQKTCLAYQFNALKIMEAILMLNFIYWPNPESTASYTRMSLTKLLLFPSKAFVTNIFSLSTNFGFSKNTYSIIAKPIHGKLNAVKRSHWRYGAMKFYYGPIANFLLVLRDQLVRSPIQESYSVKYDFNTNIHNRRTATRTAPTKKTIDYRDFLEKYQEGTINQTLLRKSDMLFLNAFNFFIMLTKVFRKPNIDFLKKHPPQGIIHTIRKFIQ